jgi:hypothetical protein
MLSNYEMKYTESVFLKPLLGLRHNFSFKKSDTVTLRVSRIICMTPNTYFRVTITGLALSCKTEVFPSEKIIKVHPNKNKRLFLDRNRKFLLKDALLKF